MKITKNALTYVITGGLFLIPFIPFIVSSSMFFPFITGKGFAFRILIEVLFGLYAFLAAIAPEYRPKKSWITYTVLIFAAITLIADLQGMNVFKSFWSNFERMEGFVLIAHLVLYFFVLSGMFRTSVQWKQFWNISLLAGVIMSIYGVLQLAGKLTINQGGVRLDATFGNSAYLAIYLVFQIFIALYLLIGENVKTWQKWLYGLASLLFAYDLYFTATRGAILGLIGGLILAALLVLWKEKESRTLRRAAYGVLIGVIVVFLGFLAIRNTSFVAKSTVLSRFSSLSTAELETQGRYYVWPMALKGIAERPILGWGQENFNFVFNKFYDPRMYGQEQWFDRTHDIVLDWLIAGGIVGFLAYVSMYIALLYYIWRKDSPLSVGQKSLFTGMIAAYVFHNIFVFDNLISYLYFFAILAFVHASSTARSEEPQGAFYTKTISPTVAYYAVLPVVAIATIAAVYFVNVPAIEASTTLIQAITPQQTGGVEKNLALFQQVFSYHSFGSAEALEQLVQVSAQVAASQQVSDTTKQGFYNLGKTEIANKLAATPTDTRYLLFAGTFYNRFGQYDAAIDVLNKAVVTSPKKQSIYFELGTSYLGKGDTQKAFEIFQTGYNIEPASPDAKIVYAIGAIYTKNQPLIKEILSQIDPNTIISDNRFLQTYAAVGDYNSVISILNARIAKDPTNLQYQLSLASAYATIGQKQKAIDIIRQMETEAPDFKAQGDQYIQQIQDSK